MAELAVGATFCDVVAAELPTTQIVQYAGASGDFNPLHTDERYAKNVGGFPSVFAHGMLTAGLTANVLVQASADAFVERFGGRFVAQVWPGDTLTTEATVTAIHRSTATLHFELQTRNQDNEVVFTGQAVLQLDPDDLNS